MKDYKGMVLPVNTKVWEFGGLLYQDEPTVAYITGALIDEMLTEHAHSHRLTPYEAKYDWAMDLLESQGETLHTWLKSHGAKHGHVTVSGVTFDED